MFRLLVSKIKKSSKIGVYRSANYSKFGKFLFDGETRHMIVPPPNKNN
jgi:hypothetical protein